MENSICDAISKKSCISFKYKDEIKTVEPFLLGYHKTTNNLVLRAYCLSGCDKIGWHLFTVTKIGSLKILSTKINANRENYNPNDSEISRIICKI